MHEMEANISEIILQKFVSVKMKFFLHNYISKNYTESKSLGASTKKIALFSLLHHTSYIIDKWFI